jgi:hypothetical protein
MEKKKSLMNQKGECVERGFENKSPLGIEKDRKGKEKQILKKAEIGPNPKQGPDNQSLF